MRLKDRVAIVTGAQQGIGKAIALAFGREGARVVVNYLDDPKGANGIVEEIEASGTAAVEMKGNIANSQDVAKLVAAAESWGGADILVNNAGVFPRGTFLEMSESQWDEVIGINLKGPFLCTRDVARSMVGHGRGGVIVNISSIVASIGAVSGAHYTASKAGLIGLTRANALELAPHGIRVNAIAPGIVDTAQPRQGMTEEEISNLGESLPLGRVLEAEEIADTAVFLASDMSKQITGQTIHVNGGHIFR